MVTDELKSLVGILEHISIVRGNLLEFANRLHKRAITHDTSKLSLDEFEEFIELGRISRAHPFGSVEYNESIKDNKAVALHISSNSHHPEHYPDGANDMSLLDFIEMVCDWKAVNDVKGRKEKTAISWEDSLEVHRKRFNLTDGQMWLIRLIAKELE